ncbi:MAG: two-component sensor histidine kinase [Crocinitomix sp.]|jgi:two-component sensor histidine kinase
MQKILIIALYLIFKNIAFSQSSEEQFDTLNVQFYDAIESNFDSAPAILDEQRIVALEIGDMNKIGSNYNNRARYWSMVPNSEDSLLFYAELTYNAFAEIPDLNKMAQTKINIASFQKLYGYYDACRASLKIAFNCAVKAENKVYISRTLNVYGSLESGLGNDLLALEFYQKSLEISESIEDSVQRNRASPKGQLGLLYSHQGHLEKAESHIKDFIADNIKLDNYWLAAQWTNNLVGVQLKSGDTTAARFSAYEAIQLAEKAGFKYAIANACVSLSQIYLMRNEIDSATFYLDRIHAELPVIDEIQFLAMVAEVEGQFYHQTGDYNKALKEYDKASEIWSIATNYLKLAPLAKQYAATYAKLKDFRKAVEYEQLHKVYSDSLLNQKKIEDFKELELTYAFSRKQYADSLDNLKAVQALELGYQKDLLNEQKGKIAMIFGLIILCVVLFLIIFAYRRNRKQKELLNQKNAKIEEALAQNQLLLKEVHHRVKNNFQIVSSLLELQSKGIEDEKALELAKEGQNRVKSMAMIHQRLYQNDDLMIDFSDYLDKLVGDIARTYDKDGVLALELEIDGGNYTFDIDTAIPLGLIVNELVTNAFKYGFKVDSRLLKVVLNKEEGEFYCLRVIDNGAGIPEDLDIQKTKSLGLRLVKRLSKQLQGNVSFECLPESTFIVRFKDTEQRLLID